MADYVGRIFDRKYRLVRLIGEGGMGEVYEAEHTLIERRTAVKVMHSEFTSSEEVVNRFFREAEAASAIGHPNIVEIFDVGQEEDGAAFIVMELLRGHSLSTEIKEGGAMAPARAVSIILQVLSALAASHEKGIIHRDLKPDNVYLAVDNRGRPEVKLLDFGIAKMQTEADGDTGLTKTGTVLGTPNYMSPEAARGKDIDGRIDIWAAGVMLYEMLSGRLPYRGSSYNAVLSDILLETPPSIVKLAPNLPPELVKVVEKAMEKDRDRRYGTVPEMIADLMPFIEDAALSDTAAVALKNSLMPPPPALGDTVACAPSADSFVAASATGAVPPAGPRTGGMNFPPLPTGGINPPGPPATAGLPPLQSGIADAPVLPPPPSSALPTGSRTGRGNPFQTNGMSAEVPRISSHYPPPPRKRRGLAVLIALGVAAAAVLGIAGAVKKENQSIGQAALSLVDQATGYWKRSPLWPGDKTAPIPPEVEEPILTPVPEMPIEDDLAPDGGDADPDDVVFITVDGVPKNGRITLDGKPADTLIELPRSNVPVRLLVTDPSGTLFDSSITPDDDHSVTVKNKKARNRKRRWKKRPRRNR